MSRNMTVPVIRFSASAAVAALVCAAAMAGTHKRANGEIIGKVELGSGPVEYAVVSLTDVSGSFPAPAKPVTLDQREKQFLPHVLAILKGTTVRFSNSDPFLHNVFSSSRVKTFNVSQSAKGDYSDMLFDKPGLIPIKCHIHANMKGFIVVLTNPYFGVTNEKGLFKISDVPAGTYTMKVWSEHSSTTTQSITVEAGGRAKAIIKVSE
ncbi:MAG: carboxypeptidase regulatory-like domain-containing protein [Fimbriimonas sp.]|nr:carboxypeptidase regulatory-like domain-containing protein [Fimbriimonas sp.]